MNANSKLNPKTEPWGTPYRTDNTSDLIPLNYVWNAFHSI